MLRLLTFYIAHPMYASDQPHRWWFRIVGERMRGTTRLYLSIGILKAKCQRPRLSLGSTLKQRVHLWLSPHEVRARSRRLRKSEFSSAIFRD